MNLAKATPADFRRFWSIYRCAQRIEYADDTTRRRCEAVILGRIDQLGNGGFTRVVMGAEILIEQACDPALDYLDLNPEIRAALELAEKTACEGEANGEAPIRDPRTLDLFETLS